MESLPTSKLRFLDNAGLPIASPQEWTASLIELLVPAEQWELASLSLQQRQIPIRLTKLAGRTCILADWPRANPGHYELHAKWAAGQERRLISVLPQKISSASFQQMLMELETTLPAAVAMALQRMGALSGIQILPPSESTLAQEMNRLRRAIQGTATRAGLASVLEDLAERPYHILQTEELWVKAQTARRPHPARLKDAICLGRNHDPSGKLRTVLDSRVRHSVDVYENRLLRVFKVQVQHRLRALERALATRNSEVALTEELHRLSRRLTHARQQAAFLENVSLPRNLPTRTTMVLLKRPPYRSALQGFIEFQKCAAIRMEEPRLDSPLAELPGLYQIWATMWVICTLLEVADTLGYRVHSQQLVRKELDGLCVRILPNGEPAIVLMHPETHAIVKLIPERTYGRTGDLHSISFLQRPDIAVEVESPGQDRAIYLFDPKYKLASEQLQGNEIGSEDTAPPGTPKKVDIDKMHSYRDSIRDASLGRVVRYAAVLYPGSEIRYADDIEALQAYPGHIDLLQLHLREVLTAAMRVE